VPAPRGRLAIAQRRRFATAHNHQNHASHGGTLENIRAAEFGIRQGKGWLRVDRRHESEKGDAKEKELRGGLSHAFSVA
jgi:hypothetical protein